MKQRKQHAEVRPRKRWIVIGPGIVLALILAIQIVIASREKSVRPPIIERQVVGSGVAQSVRPAPEVAYILEHSDRLALSDRQVKALSALQSDWQSRSRPLSEDLEKAAGEFGAFMKETGSKATVPDIQSHAGSFSELSREVSSLRRVYWEKAIQVLSEQQRKVIDKELARGYQPKPARPTGGIGR